MTSGHMQAGAPYVGDFDETHILNSEDRALLQGFAEPLRWPASVTESRRRDMIAQCVIPGFARVVSEAAFKYQLAVRKAAVAAEAMKAIEEGSDEAAMMLLEMMDPSATGREMGGDPSQKTGEGAWMALEPEGMRAEVPASTEIFLCCI